jgi:hypothetical protein
MVLAGSCSTEVLNMIASCSHTKVYPVSWFYLILNDPKLASCIAVSRITVVEMAAFMVTTEE